LLLSTTLLACVQATACPVADLLATRYGISFSGFNTALPASAAPDTGTGGPYVRIQLRDTANVADGFRHAVLVDMPARKAWILRTGGFVGVHQWYGPVDIGDATVHGCRLEALRVR
jgi:hypothetical protein